MTLPAKPTTFEEYFHYNLLLWLALNRPHLTIRKIANHLYYYSESGESAALVFPEGELRKYCGALLTILKRENNKQQLALKLDEEFESDLFELVEANLLLTSVPSSHPPRPPARPPQNQQKNMSRSPHRSRPKKRDPEDDSTLEEAIKNMNVTDDDDTKSEIADTSIRYANSGQNCLRVYRANITDEKDDPNYSVDVIKARLSLTQQNMLAAGGASKLTNSITAKIHQPRKPKHSRPQIAIGIPSCCDDFDSDNAQQIQAYEDKKFGMHGANLHQQETADIIEMTSQKKNSYTQMNLIDVPLDAGEKLDNSCFNGDQIDEVSLKTVVSIPGAKQRILAGTRSKDIQVGFVAVVACVTGTYKDLKEGNADDPDDDEFDNDEDQFFGGGETPMDE